jgi:hypothetical protein
MFNLLFSWINKSILDENGTPDIDKIRPIVYGTGNSSYYGIGRNLGKAFSIRKERLIKKI